MNLDNVDWEKYLENNKDLCKYYYNTVEKIKNHWINQGKEQGRTIYYKDEKIPELINEPSVSIIIRTKNRLNHLKNCLKSISKLNYKNFDVIIVNDCSTDGTKEYLKDSNYKVINLEKTNTSAELYNIGIRNSDSEFVAFADDDCIVDENWLIELIKPYFISDDIICVGGKSFIGNTEKLYFPGQIVGCNMSFRRSIFKKFEFDKNLKYSHLHDETELILRLVDKNYKVYNENKAIIKHFIDESKLKSVLEGAEYEPYCSHLNWIYMHCKKLSLKKYYKYVMFYIFNNNKNKFVLKHYKFNLLSKHKKNIFKIIREYYILLIEIPLNSRIQNYKDNKKLKNE
ncbi:glycosyltransferase family 2 protein [Candidatus Woesearchaeota archaeon]|nr:glycosyltransferase family 2 protein [Candidatus Woesearchaeota archaeon]